MIKFITADTQIEYSDAVHFMQKTIEGIRQGNVEVIWFLEHPALYTAGTSAKNEDLLNASLPIFETQRGGKHTYHGPGQLVVYVMLDLKKRGNDVRLFVQALEEWIISTLKTFGLCGVRKPGRIGVWLDDEKGESKIAAIGVRVTHGITWHGLSLNVHPDLMHYQGIVPCGLKEFPVTSLKAEGIDVPISEVIEAMQRNLPDFFHA
ncbi:MAG: lipoyl(octanoyl) transferase LipB [Pseudomonadota bacterium]|jgi:lipoyl(octanoyl) transferase|nr:lipoyl(octanoyl) transferase LipB [Alphaproteobacteria bacterium]